MATDKRGRKLPKGIRQRYNDFEGRFMYEGNRYLVHGKTVTETQKAMTELKYKLEHGLFVAKAEIILDEWFETWLNEYKKNRVKAGTLQTYKEIYVMCVEKRLGDKKISAIRGEHIQKLYNDLYNEGYSSSTIEITTVILGGCFKQAMINGLVERNPVKLTEKPRKKESKKRIAMTKEQQALFMEYAKDSYLYNLLAVMLRTGLRSGEIRGLKYTDIDKKNKVLHVERTLKYLNGEGFFEQTPKTKTSKRDIPLTSDVLQLLDAQRTFWGFKIEKMDRYLFCNEMGEPLQPQRVTTEIRRIIKQIHKDGHEFPDITPHVFRHTFATRAIEAGMQPQVLKTILGHSSLAMTMDLYSHVLPDTKMEEMEKIANVF